MDPSYAWRGDVRTARKATSFGDLVLGMFSSVDEVGIGVLLVSLDIFYQTGSLDVPGIRESISSPDSCLALNLCLTGLFITCRSPAFERHPRRKKRWSRRSIAGGYLIIPDG